MALAISQGGTSQTTAEGARIALGLGIGSSVQAWDADLDALAALSTAGIIVRTGAGTAATRSIVGTANQITVTNGDGVVGNPTLSLPALINITAMDISGNLELGAIPNVELAIAAAGAPQVITGTANEITVTGGGGATPTISLPNALTFTGKTVTGGTFTGITDIAVVDGGTGASTAANARINLGLEIGVDVQAFDADLSAIAALASNGVVVRTGAGTASVRTITGTANEITVTDGDGVAGNPTVSLPATIALAGKTVTGLHVTDAATFDDYLIATIIVAAGGQVVFPAAENLSADPNTLDDYEEGTWTPAFRINASTAGITSSTAIGIYTKVGRMVHAAFEIQLTNKGASVGNVSIASFPFTIANVAGSVCVGYSSGWATLGAGGGLSGLLSGTVAAMYFENAGGTGVGAVNNTHVTNTSRIFGTITYNTTT